MNPFSSIACQLLDNVSAAVIYTDVDGIVRYVNESAKDGFGFETCVGDSLEDLELDEYLKTHMLQMSSQVDETQAEVRKFIDFEAAGNEKTSLLCVPLINEDGSFEGYGYTINGISAEQVRDKVLVHNILEYCADKIYFKDLDSRFLCCSQALAEQMGVQNRRDMEGKSDFDFWDNDFAEAFYEAEQTIVRTGTQQIGKTESGVLPNGQPVWSITSKMPLRDQSGEIIGTFGINKDITANRLVELELEETNRQLINASRQAGMAEVATNVIHNVGNVLNSVNISVSEVQNSVQNLKVDNLTKIATMIEENVATADFFTADPRGTRIPQYLQMVASELVKNQNRASDELDSMRRNLDHIKTIVSMQQKIAIATQLIEETDLSRLIEDAISISSSSLKRHNIEIERNFRFNQIVKIDKHQVLQILVNLIRNAKHACQDGNVATGKIIVTVDACQDSIQISIQDNGIGIEEQNLTKLFSHGFTTRENGHGFGLHSGANCAKQMGGSLIATSDGCGLGATFTLTLPIDPLEKTSQDDLDLTWVEVETSVS
jgi:PAS domain S-box-containing protein